MSTPTDYDLLGNIVAELCAATALYPKGGCNALLDNGLTEAALLPLLQTNYPANGWDATQLADILALGRRRGAIIQCTQVDPPVYLISLEMARVNPRTLVFRDDGCTFIYGLTSPPNQFS